MLNVSESGFYHWRSRPPSQRAIHHAWLTDQIRAFHAASRGTYNAPRFPFLTVNQENSNVASAVLGHRSRKIEAAQWKGNEMGTETSSAEDDRVKSERREVRFNSGADECAAWLYIPAATAAPQPLVIMGHGLGAVREMRLDAFAERFAAQGWSVLVFDYRHLGASGGRPRQLLDIDRQLEDWHAALAYARTLPGIDMNRIAVWGSSFGGGHALQIGAEDARVAAVVAQCPFTDGPASTLARLRGGPLSALVLATAGVVDVVASWFGAKPVLMPMAGTPWMPAFLVSRDTVSGASQLVPSGTKLSARASAAVRRLPALRGQLSAHIELSDAGAASRTSVGRDSIWGVLTGLDNVFAAANALSARLVLRLPFYRPGKAMALIQAPTLVCVCDRDAVAPPDITERYAEGLAHIQVKSYTCDHFDIYVGTDFEQAVADQIDFLATQFEITAPRRG